eukprot:CAMPEP_0194113230 /NCGR_PEP_ID=MMETSP0150-20130528/15772_1 /TAXON_ID=122233 /ORGANISM="Chaetoceros debilis, Strain MM31A-1" /LENGTH=872 /DNA_ID=CAMNT_0038803101 /DNA_START=124 /DNA_END=2740 /DNA_ORIENTATION=-
MVEDTPKAKKLSSTAKVFTPLSSTLKASAASWNPVPGAETKKTAEEIEASPLLAKEDEPEQVAPATPPTKSAPTGEAKETSPAPAPILAPKPVVSAWGKKSSNAVKAAPTTDQQSSSGQNQNSSHGRDRDGRNNNRDDKKGGWKRNQQRENKDNNKDGSSNWRRDQKKNVQTRKKEDDNDGWQRGKLVPLDLFKPDEEGDTVCRIHLKEILNLRLSYVGAPLKWETDNIGPPAECRWIADSRVQEIDASANKQRLGGDVSSHRRKKKEHDTAPALEDCKPLEVNNDTRWVANVFKKDQVDDETATESDDVVLKKSLLILNKLSLTKFDKLSDKFIDSGIGRNRECLAGAIALIVKKAQDEPHFAAMYAALCLKLSKTPMSFEDSGKKKVFKKMLLTECQKEFELDTEQKIAKAVEGVEDEEDKNLKVLLVKRHFLGHMRFIGELYKGDLIGIKIMLMVLSQLLEGEAKKDSGVDEEKIECFAKLMTVIGDILEQQCAYSRSAGKIETSERLEKCWKQVNIMAGREDGKGPEISNRIKFMLQDLLEMKANGWTSRREEESAKTIAQIHKDAAKEARRGGSTGVKRSTSSSSLRRQSKPTVDADGFVEVVGTSGGTFNRSLSMGNFPRNNSRSNLNKNGTAGGGSKRPLRSSGGSFAAFNNTSQPNGKEIKDVPKESETIVKEYLTPDECGKKAKNYLKEFFVAGDDADAVLSIHELVDVGAEGSIDRGAKVIESSLLMLLEGKADEVDKSVLIITRCFEEKKIESASFVAGLNDPLEFLSDIAIDAPLASAHLVTAIAAFVKAGAIQFDFFLNSPEYFRTDCCAAAFACKVLRKIDGDSSTDESNLAVIAKLMTDGDREQHSTAKNFLLNRAS